MLLIVLLNTRENSPFSITDDPLQHIVDRGWSRYRNTGIWLHDPIHSGSTHRETVLWPKHLSQRTFWNPRLPLM